MSINSRLNRLVEELKLTPRAFAISISVEPAKFHHYVSGRLSEPGVGVLQKIKEVYTNVNTDYLLLGTEPILLPAEGVREKGKVMGKVIEENKFKSTQNEGKPYDTEREADSMVLRDHEQAKYPEKTPSYFEKNPSIHVYAVDSQQNELIPMLPLKAAAGGGYINEEVLEGSDYIRLPDRLLKPGVKISIGVRGESMAPTFLDGSHCIVRLLERSEWRYLPDEHVCVVVDMDNQAYFKRVKNRFDRGFITLMSDNPDKATYPNFNLQEDEIASIWFWHCQISFKAPNIHNMFYSRISRLEDSVELLTNEIETIKKGNERH